MAYPSEVPFLTTASNGPIGQLEQKILNNQIAIEAWFRNQWRLNPAPLYSSVDLRNAGFKVAPVDTNLFSAGFNNLNPAFMPLCIQAMQATLEQIMPGCLRLLLIPENHTRNVFYYESLGTLQTILQSAGFDVRIGSLREDLTAPESIELPSGRQLTLEPLQRKGNRIGVENFSACVVILNNDLSGGVPDMLQNISQPTMPPIALGWQQRLKSTHFKHYRDVATEFAELIDLDPWLLDPLFTQATNINFLKREGEEEVASKVDSLLADIKKKYLQYGVSHEPFVVVKADAGTYGMGIMMVHSGHEIFELNRKERTRMAASKGNQAITHVIIQEGVYSFETLGEQQAVAEPVVYMIGQYVVGGFYRVHNSRGINENLNAPGMHFEPLAFANTCNTPNRESKQTCQQNRFYSYGVVARLAAVAAAREMADVKQG